MQNGEGQFVDKEKEKSRKNKKPLKLRVTIFFYGTLNNRINIEQRELGSDVYKANPDEDGEPTSYHNGRTNIAIMEPHIEEPSEGYDYSTKRFVEGQGTLNLKKDSKLGYSLGGGGTLKAGWGRSISSHVTGEKYKPLPDRLDISFFSYAEKQFYKGEFLLSYDEIFQ